MTTEKSKRVRGVFSDTQAGSTRKRPRTEETPPSEPFVPKDTPSDKATRDRIIRCFADSIFISTQAMRDHYKRKYSRELESQKLIGKISKVLPQTMPGKISITNFDSDFSQRYFYMNKSPLPFKNMITKSPSFEIVRYRLFRLCSSVQKPAILREMYETVYDESPVIFPLFCERHGVSICNWEDLFQANFELTQLGTFFDMTIPALGSDESDPNRAFVPMIQVESEASNRSRDENSYADALLGDSEKNSTPSGVKSDSENSPIVRLPQCPMPPSAPLFGQMEIEILRFKILKMFEDAIYIPVDGFYLQWTAKYTETFKVHFKQPAELASFLTTFLSPNIKPFQTPAFPGTTFLHLTTKPPISQNSVVTSISVLRARCMRLCAFPMPRPAFMQLYEMAYGTLPVIELGLRSASDVMWELSAFRTSAGITLSGGFNPLAWESWVRSVGAMHPLVEGDPITDYIETINPTETVKLRGWLKKITGLGGYDEREVMGDRTNASQSQSKESGFKGIKNIAENKVTKKELMDMDISPVTSTDIGVKPLVGNEREASKDPLISKASQINSLSMDSSTYLTPPSESTLKHMRDLIAEQQRHEELRLAEQQRQEELRLAEQQRQEELRLSVAELTVQVEEGMSSLQKLRCEEKGLNITAEKRQIIRMWVASVGVKPLERLRTGEF